MPPRGRFAQNFGLGVKEKLENPIVFQGLDTVSGNPSSTKLHGFDVTLLIDVCKAIVAAKSDGNLTKNLVCQGLDMQPWQD